MKVLRVQRPGILTTVQDLGRFGFGHLGVPRSGAADPRSARIVNLLAGNRESDAVVEMTAAGAEFGILADTVLAHGGALMSARLDRDPCAPWRPCRARAGQTLAFGPAESGWRTYLAVAGGIEVPLVLGSRSTNLSAGFGGHEGRRLASRDELSRGPAGGRPRKLPEGADPRIVDGERIVTLHVLEGPQAADFPAAGLKGFFDSVFEILPESNRAGLRLGGMALPPAQPAEIESEGVAIGSVQVPAGGLPIILLGDGPVTGGYPKIATIIAADLPAAGQLKPRDRVRFAAVTREEARAKSVESERIFELLEEE